MCCCLKFFSKYLGLWTTRQVKTTKTSISVCKGVRRTGLGAPVPTLKNFKKIAKICQIMVFRVWTTDSIG